VLSTLPPEVVSLVHHIELHDSSWWDEAIGRIALACLLNSGVALDVGDLSSVMRKEFGLQCSPSEVQLALNRLESTRLVVPATKGRYAATQEARSECSGAAEEFRALEAEVASVFQAFVQNACGAMDIRPDWDGFRDRCLLRLLAREGAQAAALSLGCANGDGGLSEILTEYVRDLDPDGLAGLAACIESFLGSGDLTVREYVLRQLDAQFIVAAAALDARTIEALTDDKAKRLVLRLVLDTNFLFSLLGWHDHPSNELASALQRIAEATDPSVDVELLVLPSTVDETQNAIALKADRLEAIRWTRSLAEAALEFGTPGLVAQYLESQANTDYSLSIVEYADMLSHDLETRLESLGAIIVDEDLAAYSMRDDVVNSINDQLAYEKANRPESHRREYQVVKHDMVAYHWVMDHRPAQMRTAVDAGYWLVTLDFRLLGFDRYRCRGKSRAQVCLLPSTAVQFLQFWVPSSEELKSAIFSSVRQPLFPASNLAETEQVTYRIIERLGVLAGIEDISAAAIRDTLADDVLRKRMGSTTDQDEELEFVEAAFVRLASEKEQELEAERTRAKDLKRELDQVREESRRQQEIEDGRKVQVARLKTQAQEADARANKLDGVLRQQLTSIDTLSKRLDTAENASAHLRWSVRWVYLPAVVFAVVGLGLGALAVLFLPSPLRWVAVGLVALLLLLAFLSVVAYSHRRVPEASSSRLARGLASARKWLLGALGAVAVALIASVLWDVVKSAF